MIYGIGDKAWIKSDVPCKVSRNGSFIQITYKESGLNKCILIPYRYLEKISELQNHRDTFETFVEISEPANWHTLEEENQTRREDFRARLNASTRSNEPAEK